MRRYVLINLFSLIAGIIQCQTVFASQETECYKQATQILHLEADDAINLCEEAQTNAIHCYNNLTSFSQISKSNAIKLCKRGSTLVSGCYRDATVIEHLNEEQAVRLCDRKNETNIQFVIPITRIIPQ